MSRNSFTDRSRIILQKAREHAESFRHVTLGPEHVAVALFNEAAHPLPGLLNDLHLEPRSLREVVRGAFPPPFSRRLSDSPYAPELRTLLNRARSYSDQLGSASTGIEHLLLAILDDARTQPVLIKAGVDPATARETILGRLAPPRPS